jgi:hypothetical protein
MVGGEGWMRAFDNDGEYIDVTFSSPNKKDKK